MPLSLPKPPDPRDPDYQRLERRVNFALHVGIFAASNSGLWFVRSLKYADWDWAIQVTGFWALLLLGHFIWVSAKK
jgi:2TM domain